ncbi:MAG: hypothetical protein ACYTG0_20270 [Planctomycetota bacterium]|jgi:ELWxxDGT repeat protein
MLLTIFRDALYFLAKDQSRRIRLWKHDGESVFMVPSLEFAGPIGPRTVVVYGDALFLQARDATHGGELWRYDGNSASRVADINPGSAGSNPSELLVWNDWLCFTAYDKAGEPRLFRYDGASVSPIDDVRSDGFEFWPELLVVFNEKLYLRPSSMSDKLWEYDGSHVSSIGINSGVAPERMPVVFAGALYFAGETTDHGVELWRYDGKSTSLAADVNPGSGSSVPRGFTVFEGELYFAANDESHGDELWKYVLADR